MESQKDGSLANMLTVAIISPDTTSSDSLRACLEQTGLVEGVRDWSAEPEKHPRLGETLPDVVVLDVSGNGGVGLDLANHFHQLHPGLRIVACINHRPPEPEFLLQAMRSGVQDLLSKPLTATKMQEVLERFVREQARRELKVADKLLVVMGAKGGVGTTTVAVNLGVQLAQITRKRVAVLDFARPIGHAALVLDLQPRFTVRDAVENLDRLDSHFLGGLLTRHKSGLEVLAGTTHADEWLRITPTGLARVVNVAQGAFDFVLVDAGSFCSSDWSPILRSARMLLAVTEANVPSLWTLQRHLAALLGLGVDSERIRVVVNRWHRADDEVLKTIQKDLKRPVFARLSNDFRQVSEAISLGVPLSRNHSNPLANQFQALACQLAGIPLHGEAQGRKLMGLFSNQKPSR